MIEANLQVFHYFINIINILVDFKIIPKTILIKLIDKVEVFEDKPNRTKIVKVHYKFPSP